MNISGLTDFQKALLNTENKLKKVATIALRNQGTKATAYVRKKAKREIKKKTGNYHKKFKRGKVFIGYDGALTTRVLNTSPHAHLIEDGHRMVTADGREVGFVHGKKILEKGVAEYEAQGNFAKEFSDAIDRLLRQNKL